MNDLNRLSLHMLRIGRSLLDGALAFVDTLQHGYRRTTQTAAQLIDFDHDHIVLNIPYHYNNSRYSILYKSTQRTNSNISQAFLRKESGEKLDVTHLMHQLEGPNHDFHNQVITPSDVAMLIDAEGFTSLLLYDLQFHRTVIGMHEQIH